MLHHLVVVVTLGIGILLAQQAHLLPQASRLVLLHLAVAACRLRLGLRV